MQYVHLGQSGLVVSRLCLGTMNFGAVVEDERTCFAIMDRALELGINYFDTANCYGSPRGRTEDIIGQWLAQGGGRRDQIVLATKLYIPTGDGVNERGLSAYHIRTACEDSLRRLQTDRIDIYIMHNYDRGDLWNWERQEGAMPHLHINHPPHLRPEVPWEEIWGAMEQLKAQGKIIYTGSSNFPGWRLAQSKEKAFARKFQGQISTQDRYNLNSRQAELEVIPACRSYGIGFTCWSPLGGGWLGGVLEKFTQGRRGDNRWTRDLIGRKRTQLEAWEALCREIGESPAEVAIAWLLHNEVVTAPIIGPRTVEQLQRSARAPDIKFSDEVLAKIDEIWPGPGGEAPDCYFSKPM